MENKSKETFGKIRSLMERLDNPMTGLQAKLNEEKCVNEATTKNRVQVGRDEIVKIIETADEIQNEKNNGLFATFTYVKPAELLKTKQSVNNGILNTALSNHADKSEEEWHKSLTSFSELENSKKHKNPITSIVTVTRYHIKWHSLKNYDNDYSDYAEKLHTLRKKYRPELITNDGYLGDNQNQREKIDGIEIGRNNRTGKFARDFNMAKSNAKPKTVAYIMDENGNIVSEIPEEVMWSIHGKTPKNSNSDGVEKYMKDNLAAEVYEEYAKAKQELDAKFKARNFIWDSILCICCSVNGTSYYYINDALVASTVKNGGVNVNRNEMIKIAQEQLGESFDVIQGFAN